MPNRPLKKFPGPYRPVRPKRIRVHDNRADAPVDRRLEPSRILDPETKVTYVLLRADLYDRSKALFEVEPFTIDEAYPLQEQVAKREGWDDPAMDAYNDLDPRPSR